MTRVIFVVTIVVLVYLLSLKINPYVTCRNCKGNPRVKGSFFGYAHRPCPLCGGTGQRLRLGRRIFFGPPKS